MPRYKLPRSKTPLVFLLLAAALLAGCIGNQSTTLTGAEKDAVLAYSEPAADRLFAAYNRGDYAAFIQDMDSKMTAAITRQQFDTGMRGTIFSKLGNYQSRQVDQVVKTSAAVTVVYRARFEKDYPVLIRLSFDTSPAHKISGLYFDSANLRKTS